MATDHRAGGAEPFSGSSELLPLAPTHRQGEAAVQVVGREGPGRPDVSRAVGVGRPRPRDYRPDAAPVKGAAVPEEASARRVRGRLGPHTRAHSPLAGGWSLRVLPAPRGAGADFVRA